MVIKHIRSCFSCGAMTPPVETEGFDTPRDLIEAEAKKAGWAVVDLGEMYCPECCKETIRRAMVIKNALF